MMRNATVPLVVVAAALAAAPSASAQTSTVTGVVRDATTSQPIASAQIQIVGTGLGALSGAEGSYAIRNVPTGPQEVRAIVLGYAQQTVETTVTPGEPAVVNFALDPQAIALDAIVVSATGVDQRQREVGNAVAQIEVDDVELSTISNVPELLQGRAPGVTVLQSSGTSGTGARIRIRGNNSISLDNEPLVIVDGVRVTANNEAGDDILGGQDWSRFNDFNAEEIETIEILKGPAASALYGTAAANGVVVITTKSGVVGDTRLSAYTEQGIIVENHDYPANYAQLGETLVPTSLGPAGAEFVGCTIPLQASGLCAPIETLSFNPLEVNSPFQDGRNSVFGLTISGGQEQVQFFVAGETRDEEGIYEVNEVDQINLRANVQAELRDDLSLGVRTGYVSNDARLPYNDNAVEGVVSSGLLGYYEPRETGGYYAYPLENRFAFQNEQGVERFIGSAQGRYTPLPWLSVNGMAGLDLLTTTTMQTLPPNVFSQSYSRDYAIGYRFADRQITRGVNSNLSAQAAFDLTPELYSTTIVGGQYIRDAFQLIGGGGYGLLPGTETLDALSERFEVYETNEEQVTVGAYVSQQIAWRDRLFLTGAIRGDDNSAFGNDFGLAFYPSLSASWVLEEEDWFPTNEVLSTLRLRAAYGESGLKPGFRTARQFFNPISATLAGDVSVPAVTIGGAGNPDLEPEESREYELGFDAGFFSDRVGLEFTYYDKDSENALVNRPLPPSLGTASEQTINIGGVSNKGIEALLTGQILRSDDVDWEASLSYATNESEILSLGEDVTGEPLPPIIFGLGTNTQRHQEGFPPGAYFQPPILGWSDENGDGLLAADEIEVGDEPTYQGTPFPTRELALNTSITLFDIAEISALVDYKGGHKLFNGTEEFRCSVFVTCRAINDPNAPLEDQARAVAARELGTVAGFFEEADFTKLRSVSLRLMVPRRYTDMAGLSALALTLSGRNLKTWTDYTGLDPELNSAGQSAFSTFDFLGQPPVRHWTARLDVTF